MIVYISLAPYVTVKWLMKKPHLQPACWTDLCHDYYKKELHTILY